MHDTDNMKYNGGRKLTWVRKPVQSSDDLNAERALKFGEGQSAGGVKNIAEKENAEAVTCVS